MNLGEYYSKSIIRKFDLVPVYYPGTEVVPGDIISFGTTIFDKAKKPFGSFSIIGNIMESSTYNFPLETKDDQQHKTYNFVSEKEVSVSAAVEAELPTVVNGDLKFTFGKKGSILLYGIGGKETRIKDLFALEDYLKTVAEQRDWNDYYIVTSVIVCAKALIYQSEEDNGSLIVSGLAKNISIGGSEISNIGVEANLSVKWKNKHSFSIDWTDNITVFMKLAQFTGKQVVAFEKASLGRKSQDKDNKLVEVSPSHLLDNEDE